MENLLINSGFTKIEFIDKENSEDIIKSWNFGAGVEKAVFSVYVKAQKGGHSSLDK